MRNYLTINGTDSRSFGVYISGQGTFAAPSRAFDYVTIPGRNGDLIMDDNRFENITVTYPAFIYTNFDTNLANFRAFLLSLKGYVKLADSYHTSEFRMASYQGPFEPEVTKLNDAGSFNITFICKPQRFLTSGETVVTFTANGNITNPTKFASKPLIRAYGTGSFYISGTTVTISSASTYTDIDCELMDCYKASISKNEYVSFSSNDFPTIGDGIRSVTLSGITKLEITPRWWTV